MASYSWIVLTNCRDGRNAAFEEWYDTVHIPDLLRVPGIVSATRGKATPAQAILTEEGAFALTRGEKPPFEYMAIYKLETDDPEAVLQEVMGRAFTPEMPISADLCGVQATLFATD
jgi:hypothetical protein